MITKPFIKWAGGKSWLTSNISKYLPNDFNDYYEPFLGAGSIFFSLSISGNVYLSDLNNSLINVYSQIKYNTEELIQFLDNFTNSESEFYRIRAMKSNDPIYEAARFIYLNKTCFNGIYRVNSKGIFNVPYGHNQHVNYYSASNIYAVKEKLLCSRVNLSVDDFEFAIRNVKRKDLVFLDPPYTVSHRNKGFIEYNQKLFMWEDQQRLANCVAKLNRIGAYYILTNAVHSSILELYAGTGNYFEVTRNSTMSSNSLKRGKIGEYIFTNCI